MERNNIPKLGTIYLPTGSGVPVGKFQFVVDPNNGKGVQIGTPVAAETSEGVVVGVVNDMCTIGAMRDPLMADLKNVSGDFMGGDVPDIPEVMLATVQVFHADSMRPIRFGYVRAATAAEMEEATGRNRMDWPISAGVLPLAEGEFAGIALDGLALLGPESAHLTIGGLSGQAAKTSFAGVLLKAAIDAGSEEQDSVAAIIFNVKGDDLCYLDQPPAQGYELTDEDFKIYEAMGVNPTPFEKVSVYSPGLPGGGGSRSPREDAQALRWDLVQVWPYLKYLIPALADDEKLQSFYSDFEMRMLKNPNVTERVDTFAKLETFFRENLEDKEEAEEQKGWRSHHPATLMRLRRMLGSIPARCGGLVKQDTAKETDDIPTIGWRHGEILVVDIAGLNVDVQGLAIARITERLLKRAEAGELGVDHLIVFADELNSFAPNQGAEMAAVKKILEKVATQGRYAGVSVWGAAQKLSRVSELLVSNAATRALGITADSELSSGIYGRLSDGLSERIATLPKGWMALWHYSFRSAIVVRFPRPAWRTGKAKAGRVQRKRNTLDSLGLNTNAVARLTEGIPPELVEEIIAKADNKDRAIEELKKARTINMEKAAVVANSDFDPTDPFA